MSYDLEEVKSWPSLNLTIKNRPEKMSLIAFNIQYKSSILIFFNHL